MKTFLGTIILFFASTAAAFAAAAVQYGQVYECHQDGGKFRVLDCAGEICNVFYLNKYSPGGGFKTRMTLASLHQAIDGKPAPCSIRGAAENVQASGARRGKPAQNPVSSAPQHYAGMYADIPKYKAPAPGGGITLAKYECYTFSGGRLNSALALNFRLLDGQHYTDAAGQAGTYAYNAGSGKILFNGAALAGIRATFRAGTQPFKNHPPTVTFANGDTCDARVK